MQRYYHPWISLRLLLVVVSFWVHGLWINECSASDEAVFVPPKVARQLFGVLQYTHPSGSKTLHSVVTVTRGIVTTTENRGEFNCLVSFHRHPHLNLSAEHYANGTVDYKSRELRIRSDDSEFEFSGQMGPSFQTARLQADFADKFGQSIGVVNQSIEFDAPSESEEEPDVDNGQTSLAEDPVSYLQDRDAIHEKSDTGQPKEIRLTGSVLERDLQQTGRCEGTVVEPDKTQTAHYWQL